jgi:2-dehydropantoate 2-reductase
VNANWPQSIAIIGAGAVGGYYGARLIQHGHTVYLHMRSDAAAVRKSGLQIKSCDGDFILGPTSVHAFEHPRQMPKVDLVIVTLKTTANSEFAELIAPILKENTAIFTLQNGLGNEERLAHLFGSSRILGGVAFVCINRIAPGVISHTDHGLIRLSEMAGRVTERARAVARLFTGSKVACETTDNLAATRWEKLIWNIPFNGLGALLDLTTDKLIKNEFGLSLVHSLMREVISASKGLGIEFPDSIIQQKIEHTSTMGAYKSSMQIDRELGRAMEIEAMFGEPLRAARRPGIELPKLEMLYHSLTLVDNKQWRLS